MKYGWVFCDRFNLHVKNHPKFPNLSPPSLVFKIKEPTKGAGSDIHMISLIGDELLTLAKFICEESMLLYVTFLPPSPILPAFGSFNPCLPPD